jgi:hypothetical protein
MRGLSDAFLMKAGADGAVLWAITDGGAAAQVYGKDVAVDSSGEIFAVGSVNGNATFGSAASAHVAVHTSNTQAFVKQVDAVTQGVDWAVAIGGAGIDSIQVRD